MQSRICKIFLYFFRMCKIAANFTPSALYFFFGILCVNTGHNDAIMCVKSLMFSNVIIFILKHMHKTLLELRKDLSVVSQWSTQYDSS